jgi:glycerol-3-phosphate dehydrogenase (NAD(P)+)
MTPDCKVAVLGAGAWGTALALVAIRAGHPCSLWGRDQALVNEIGTKATNAGYLPGISLDSGILATTDLATALSDAAIVLVATPAQTAGQIAREMRPLVGAGAVVVCCAKGIDRKTGHLPGETMEMELKEVAVAALSGPSFATDVARHLPTAVTIASRSAELSAGLAAALSSAHFRCYAGDDLKGVELGGALKNVMAIAVGATRSMQLGASAEAALIARGFAEMTRLAVALGARRETLSGLSGLGDLVLTCSGAQSRNFRYGMALGRGDPVADLPLAEGAFTAAIAAKIAADSGIEAPVITAVAQVLDRVITPPEAVRQLLERPLRQEAG